jgi:hypothetical protein
VPHDRDRVRIVATKLAGVLEREVVIHGIDSPVIVTLSSEGLSFRVKGMRLGVEAD